MSDAGREDAVIGRIVRWAERQALVRAVLLTSSRAIEASTSAGRWPTSAPALVWPACTDALSDYDLILYASDSAPLLRDDAWLRELGPVLVRLPVKERGPERHIRLVIYEDGTKIDFTVWPVHTLREAVAAPRLPDELDAGYRVLLDKDGLTAGLKAPTRSAYLPSPPAQEEFAALVEEFW